MVTIKLRRGPSAEWLAANPVLADGEVGIESAPGVTPDKGKIGDGVTVWSSLPYSVSSDWISLAERGVAGGVATLDGTGVVPVAQLPSSALISEAIDAHEIDPAGHSGTSVTNTPAGNIVATNVQAAINELDTEKASSTGVAAAIDAHEIDTAAHPGIYIPVPVGAPTPGQLLSATDDDPLTTDWIDSSATHPNLAAHDTLGLATQAELDAHAHSGTSVTNTPAGNIAATTVQGAINELDTEKVTGIVKLTVASSAPGSPATNDVWIDTT